MVRIYQIADIHILQANHDRIKYAIDVFVSRVRDENVLQRIIVVCGDIFDKKTIVSTGDLNLFHYMMKEFLSLTCPIVMIPGNHDYNGNGCASSDIKDLISAALVKYDEPNIHYHSRSNVIVLYNITFALMSPIDGIYFSAEQLTREGYSRPFAGVLHETLRNCTTGSFTITEGKYDANSFVGYDAVLCGDIHYPQPMDGEDGHVAYCGSFVQKNRGEDPLIHGYNTWDVNDGVISPWKFNQLHAYHVDVKLHASCNSVKYIDVIEPRSITICIGKDCDKAFIDQCRASCLKKYGRLDSIIYEHVGSAPIATKVAGASASETTTSGNATFSITDKLATHGEDLLKYHNNINAVEKVSYGFVNIKWVKWSNLFKYGIEPSYISFSDGLFSVEGQNATGKSTIINVLIAALFDNASKDGCNASRGVLLNNSNNANGWVEVEFEANGHTYNVRFDAARRGPTHDMYVFKCDGAVIQSGDKLQTRLAIANVIGSKSDFITVPVMLQHRESILSMTPAARNIYIKNIIGLSKYDVYLETATGALRELNVAHKNTTEKIVQYAHMTGMAMPPAIDEASAVKMLGDFNMLKDISLVPVPDFSEELAHLEADAAKFRGIQSFGVPVSPEDELSSFEWNGVVPDRRDTGVEINMDGLSFDELYAVASMTHDVKSSSSSSNTVHSVESYEEVLPEPEMSYADACAQYRIMSSMDTYNEADKKAARDALAHLPSVAGAVKGSVPTVEQCIEWAKCLKNARSTLDEARKTRTDRLAKLEELKSGIVSIDAYEFQQLEKDLFNSSLTANKLKLNEECECCKANKHLFIESTVSVLKSRLELLSSQKQRNAELSLAANAVSSQLAAIDTRTVEAREREIIDLQMKASSACNYVIVAESVLDLGAIRQCIISHEIRAAIIDARAGYAAAILARARANYERNQSILAARAARDLAHIEARRTQIMEIIREAREKNLIAEKEVVVYNRVADDFTNAVENFCAIDRRYQVVKLYVELMKGSRAKPGLVAQYIESQSKTFIKLWNDELEKIGNMRIDISFSTDAQIFVVENGRPIASSCASGFQRLAIDLTFRAACRAVRPFMNISILDEGLDCADAINRDALKSYVKSWKGTTFIISHTDEINTIADTVLNVKSLSAGSRLCHGVEPVSDTPAIREGAVSNGDRLTTIQSGADEEYEAFVHYDGEFNCLTCAKKFKSVKTIENHIRSKTHIMAWLRTHA